MDPVLCDSCGLRFSPKQLSDDVCCALKDQHIHEEMSEELRMLYKVQDFYRRHPGMEGQIKTHHQRVLESSDPSVMEKLYSCVPFDEIELPPQSLPDFPAEDQETVEYLKYHEFSLEPRMYFVSGRLAELRRNLQIPVCPACGVGRLRVDSWDEFAADGAISWLWPAWHYRDEEGTLHIKATGATLDGHWTGEREVLPDDPDFGFLSWLVGQKEYHRLVDEEELPAIRAIWSGKNG
jgi:hypothetical protein